jgi:hypothetical protein
MRTALLENKEAAMEKCPVCKTTELQGNLTPTFIVANGEVWYVGMLSIPSRNWICCENCQAMVCHQCCVYPESGYCNACFAAEYEAVWQEEANVDGKIYQRRMR